MPVIAVADAIVFWRGLSGYKDAGDMRNESRDREEWNGEIFAKGVKKSKSWLLCLMPIARVICRFGKKV